jgi:hypothetical protein
MDEWEEITDLPYHWLKPSHVSELQVELGTCCKVLFRKSIGPLTGQCLRTVFYDFDLIENRLLSRQST